VNTGLYYLFLEQLDEGDDQARMDEYRGYLEMCRENLETGLANLSMFLLPKKENIEALLLGVRIPQAPSTVDVFERQSVHDATR